MPTLSPYPVAIQRSIIITLSHDAPTTYSYLDYKGIPHIGVRSCDLSIVEPTYTLFLLDGPSAGEGWTITGLNGDYPTSPLEPKVGPFGLSIALYDDDLTPATYNFTISFLNTVTSASMCVDPQESNIPIHE